MSKTLYEQIGGFVAVRALIEDFYERVMREESLRPHFAGIEMSRLVRHQTDFFCQVLGGPANYSGRQLREAHAHLAIDEKAFDLVAQCLTMCLLDAGLEDSQIQEVVTIVVGTKADIVSSPVG